MFTIKQITGRKILNSVGQETLEVRLELATGYVARASVPEGYSKGETEACYAPVHQSIQHITNLNQQLTGLSFHSLAAFDQELIRKAGEQKKLLGANTTLACSIAFARAASQQLHTELYDFLRTSYELPKTHHMPKLMVLAFEGGDHAHSKQAIQEILMIAETIEIGKRYYELLKSKLVALNKSTAVGTEGGFCPSDTSTEEALSYAFDVCPFISLDVAGHGHPHAAAEFMSIEKAYTFYSVEDPYETNEKALWQALVASQSTLVIADDLTTTNTKLIASCAEKKMAQAAIIKPNQVGTITESIEAVHEARVHGWKIICSHRGQETNDDFIADFAYAVSSDLVKFGGFSRGERIAKYNRLLTIRVLEHHA
jgi:enolase